MINGNQEGNFKQDLKNLLDRIPKNKQIKVFLIIRDSENNIIQKDKRSKYENNNSKVIKILREQFDRQLIDGIDCIIEFKRVEIYDISIYNIERLIKIFNVEVNNFN